MVEYFVSCYREIHSCDSEVPCCIGDNKKCYRCSIGELTNEQVNDFIKKSGINDIPDFYLNTADELSISTMKGKPVHLEAKACFRSSGYALQQRLMEYFNQADCQMSDKKPPQDSLFISNLPSYLMNMANRNFSVPLRRIPPLSTIDSQTLIRRVLRPDRHIPAPFRKIIFEFRHIIIMCQFMVDAESVRKPKDGAKTDASGFDRTQTTGEPLSQSLSTENGVNSKPASKTAGRSKKPKGAIKELIKSVVEEYGDEKTNKFYANKMEICHTMLSRDPYMSHLEEAKAGYRKQQKFENQQRVKIDEEQI